MSIRSSVYKLLQGRFNITFSNGKSGVRLISIGEKIFALFNQDALRELYPNHLGHLNFICNICGQHAGLNLPKLHRESISCLNCGSSLRFRTVIHLLSVELFGKSISIPEFPVRRNIKGIGMSDWFGYANKLSEKLDYKNTFYDREPHLDITNINPEMESSLDFLITSDVYEHVVPPVSLAFENAYRLLKPGGFLIFTVPYKKYGITEEFFPNLYDFQIKKDGESPVLLNTTKEGHKEVFKNLEFHHGRGPTLTMRLFSEQSLLEEFNRAGFSQVKIANEPCFEHGIYWNRVTDIPFVLRK